MPKKEQSTNGKEHKFGMEWKVSSFHQLAEELPDALDKLTTLLSQRTEKNNAEQTHSSADSGIYTVDTGSAEHRFPATPPTKNKRYDDDAFWDLGEVRRKVYQTPSFGSSPDNTVLVEEATSHNRATIQREPIPAPSERPATPKASFHRPADNTTASNGQVRTSRYSSPAARDIQNRQNEVLRSMKADTAYTRGGLLIRHVEIKPWAANIPFYQRFAAEAARFHERKGSPCESVPFFAYVPQYSKMNDRQQNYYLHLRDSIRDGQYPPAEISYILLYIYEIINLPHKIPPQEGVLLLTNLWLNYREQLPRLDIFLCEWLADYCLIHQCALPAALLPILPQIVPKAQFKEFFLDAFPDNDMTDLATTLMEFASDYDYRRSRYYKGNEAAYEQHIPAAVAEALREDCHAKQGIFAFDKKYRITRDAYCGAVTPAEIKKRIDVEFYSFTRPIETRQAMTDLVKYAENRLRLTLKIKAKLGVDGLPEADRHVIDRYFAPMMPADSTGSAKKAAEQVYLLQYDADSTGFDFETAAKIEEASWSNTGRLTASESFAPEEHAIEVPPRPASQEVCDACKTADSNETNDSNKSDQTYDTHDSNESPEPHEFHNTHEDFALEKACLRAALQGTFRSHCKAQGLFADDMASKINEIFLALIGDIVLTDGDFQLIEDYREDVTEWLN